MILCLILLFAFVSSLRTARKKSPEEQGVGGMIITSFSWFCYVVVGLVVIMWIFQQIMVYNGHRFPGLLDA